MSSFTLVIRLAVLLAGFSATAASAAPTPAQIAAGATAKAAYPLKTCVVSGGKLGGMGRPVEFVYKQPGQPDRTVIFCCKSCIKKFAQNPATFLAKLDAAESAAKVAAQK